MHASNKMDPVKEESIDESIEVEEKTEKSEHQEMPEQSQEKSGISSLPSEDIEIKESGKSTDWQIVLKAPSHKSSHEGSGEVDEIVEEIDEDLNERESKEMDDLQSCPEETGKSQSDDHLFAKADAIADEILKKLLENYKNDERLCLSVKVNQPDEDEFKDKFPWTLDRVPEKPKEPAIIKRPAEPKKRMKTEREIADDKFKEDHQKKQTALDERHAEMSKYLDFLCKRVDLQKLLNSLNTPITKEPLKVLK